MIVGGYALHLYCDHPKHPRNYRFLDAEYGSESGSYCRQKARKDGWLLNLKENTAICPECRKD